MQIYHEVRVVPADIDDLGHMNVRVYAYHAAVGFRKLMAVAGLGADELATLGAQLLHSDSHTLFRREQLLGSLIGVRGGVLGVEEYSVTAFIELFNRETQEVAATFCNQIRLVGRIDAAPKALSFSVRQRAAQIAVDWPAYAKPRSLSMDVARPRLTIADMVSRGIAARSGGYLVTPEASTAEGFMDLAEAPLVAFAQAPMRRDPAEPAEQKGDALEDSWFSAGVVSIATLESRHTVIAVPRTGETVVTYTTITEVGRKIVRFCHWSFAQGSGQLIAVLDEVGIGINLETRRACELPAPMRAELEAQCHTELP